MNPTTFAFGPKEDTSIFLNFPEFSEVQRSSYMVDTMIFFFSFFERTIEHHPP